MDAPHAFTRDYAVDSRKPTRYEIELDLTLIRRRTARHDYESIALWLVLGGAALLALVMLAGSVGSAGTAEMIADGLGWFRDLGAWLNEIG
jgi:hypothetical protein